MTASAADAPKEERGLNEAAVARLRERYGFNELAEEPPVPLWYKFLDQFKELVIWILLAAAVISGLMGEWADALAILAIVTPISFIEAAKLLRSRSTTRPASRERPEEPGR